VITSDKELLATLERPVRLRPEVAALRQKETVPQNYHLALSGYLLEIDRMNLDVRRLEAEDGLG
jgi:hypothetical protein